MQEVLLLVFYKNTEDSLWIIRQKLSHLHTAIQNSPSSSPSHATLVSVGHLFRSVSQVRFSHRGSRAELIVPADSRNV